MELQRRGHEPTRSAGCLGGYTGRCPGGLTPARAEGCGPMAVEDARSYAELQRENARLQRELAEALEQQTATSEILRVISSSPTNLQPVLDAVVENAARACGAGQAGQCS